MARPRGHSSFPRVRGVRRAVSWVVGPLGLSTALTATGSSLSTTGTQAIADGLTLVRTRGNVAVDLGLVPDIIGGNFFTLSLGLCIVSENAAGIGITATPSPFTDIAWDGWLWHWTGMAGFVNGTNAALGTNIEIDSKAMRKFKATDVLVGVMEAVETGVAGTIQVSWASRVLLKLH